MKQLVVLSGKGGTGKTTVTAALAHLATRQLSAVLADADVDAANLELLLSPVRMEEHEFVSGAVAEIDASTCIACGRCAQVCRFGAVREGSVYEVDPLACEGCASCYYQCPVDAIEMVVQRAGLWFRSDTAFGPLFHARLFAGKENSGKLVSTVKQQAAVWAVERKAGLLLVDGPPGIGCPVIAACAGADMALLVVEPTVSGAHDLERILATTEHFSVPAMVVVNKADLNEQQTAAIRAFCARHGVDMIGEIPYDLVAVEALVAGQPVTAYGENAVSRALHAVWDRATDALRVDVG